MLQPPSETSHNTHLLSFLNGVYDREPPRLRFQAATRSEWEAWRGAGRRRLKELLTLGEIERHAWREPPPPVVTESVDQPNFVREHVLIPTLDGLWMPCFLLVPKTPPPHPAVLCLHGHGMSKHILAGVPRDEMEQELLRKYRGDYALKLADNGFLVLAPDAAGYGERSEGATENHTSADCQHLFVNALSLGLSLQGIRVWEFLRGLDYLGSRPDVQADRIAAAGLSMGCEHAMYVAALDDRFQAAVLSCCCRAIIPDAKHIPWCGCLFSSGLFTEMDWPDIAALIAPRPVQLQFGDKDYVPLGLARKAHGLMQRAYVLAGMPNSLEYDEFAGAHEFHFETALRFLNNRLSGR